MGRLRAPLIAVCGTSTASPAEADAAEAAGRLIAEGGAVVVCGGLGGVMEAAARGAEAGGGVCVGLLPGDDPREANDHVGIALATGLGEIRNALIARSCAGMIAIGGGFGTLSEIGFMLRLGRPVAAVASWDVRRPGDTEPEPAIHRAGDAAAAVSWLWSELGM
jgi:uncharacterized protein (TIGR00725 family)